MVLAAAAAVVLVVMVEVVVVEVNGVSGTACATGLVLGVAGSLVSLASPLLEEEERLVLVLLPKTHGSLALVHLSHAPEPESTEHLSF
jgi:hypothetical protein